MKRENSFHWCSECKENSVVIRCYTDKGTDERKRVLLCMNKGCGYKVDLPFPLEVTNVR